MAKPPKYSGREKVLTDLLSDFPREIGQDLSLSLHIDECSSHSVIFEIEDRSRPYLSPSPFKY